MTVRLSEMLPPQTHGAERAPQLSPEVRLSPSQEPDTAVLPSGPQPKKSLLRSPVSRRVEAHDEPPHDDVAAAGTVPGVSSG